jgi:hypothetical protein
MEGNVLAVPKFLVFKISYSRVASIPVIAIAVHGDGRDAIIPILGRVVWKTDAAQVVQIPIDAEITALEINIVEDAHPRPAKYTDCTDCVVEAGRQNGPAVTLLHAKVVSPETSVPVEAGPGLGRMWSAPLILGKCRKRRKGQKQNSSESKSQSHSLPL